MRSPGSAVAVAQSSPIAVALDGVDRDYRSKAGTVAAFTSPSAAGAPACSK